MLCAIGVLSGCLRAPIKPFPTLVPAPVAVPVTRSLALVRVSPENLPAFQDDVDAVSLRAAAVQSMSYYQSLPESQLFVLGTDTYTAKEMADSMDALVTV